MALLEKNWLSLNVYIHENVLIHNNKRTYVLPAN